MLFRTDYVLVLWELATTRKQWFGELERLLRTSGPISDPRRKKTPSRASSTMDNVMDGYRYTSTVYRLCFATQTSQLPTHCGGQTNLSS